jgi:hypothetical protein
MIERNWEGVKFLLVGIAAIPYSVIVYDSEF